MEKEITLSQGYKAMYQFMRGYYYRTGKPEAIGRILSDLQLLSDLFDDPKREWVGDSLNTADPASWSDWLEAVNLVLSEENQSKGA